MGDMGEISAAGFDFLNDRQCLLDIEMSRMRGIPKGIENQHIQISKLVESGLRYFAAIGAVGEIIDSKPQDRYLSMKKIQGYDFPAEEIEGTIDFHCGQIGNFGKYRTIIIEGICKDGLEGFNSLWRAVAGNPLFLQGTETPDVVKAENMIGVSMSKQQRVNGCYIICNALESKFWGSIDNRHPPTILDHQAAAMAFVTGIRRSTNGTLTGNHRDSMGSPGAHECKDYSSDDVSPVFSSVFFATGILTMVLHLG